MIMDTITINNRTFSVSFEYDEFGESPWACCDGHGPVRRSNVSHWKRETDKKPGERPMNSPGRNEYQFYYDWQTAMKIAIRDGWNTQPYDAPSKALRAVQADFDYLAGFVNGHWEYVVVTVTDDETGESDSLGMVETYRDYHLLQAQEMVQGLYDRLAEEESEVAYWQARDVQTIGA